VWAGALVLGEKKTFYLVSTSHNTHSIPSEMLSLRQEFWLKIN
jgi:hypothetical protein